MKRYQTDIVDGTLRLETPEGWIDVGTMDDILALVDGPEYTIQYAEEETAGSWLQTDENNAITFDVRDHLAEMDYREDFVTNVANAPMDPGEDGYPKRTVLFTDLMMEIWDSKGTLE